MCLSLTRRVVVELHLRIGIDLRKNVLRVIRRGWSLNLRRRVEVG
jgi:hypothetical protein